MELEDLLERALTLADEEEWESVVDFLQDHIEDFEKEPAIHCWLGVAQRELGMEGAAFDSFKRTLSLTPADPYVLATAGNGIAAFDDPDAETALRTAALTAPQIAVTRLLYGAYLSREGFAEESLKELTAAREIDPDDPQIAYELGVAHALAGDYDRATDVMAEAVSLDPEDGWSRVVFGLALLEAQRMDEGVGELVAGARMREEDVDAQLAAALATAATGRDGLAYEMLERARIRAADADLVLVTAVEDRLDGGHEAAAAMLMEDFVPDLLRSRLSERP